MLSTFGIPIESESLTSFSFIQAKNYTPANRTEPYGVNVICLHTMETGELKKTAANVAAWFAGPDAPMASAHFCVDDQEIIQCVHEKDIAWHAPGANRYGIGIEHAGYAKQTPAEWHDDYSTRMLSLSARLVANICYRYNIPVVHLSVDDLKAGRRGICGHIDCTNAFSNGVGHWDPGPGFPYSEYLDKVRFALAQLQLDDSAADTLPGT
jgi:N-acetyl-anhydromuramyl-L-alanine amidase AmpD